MFHLLKKKYNINISYKKERQFPYKKVCSESMSSIQVYRGMLPTGQLIAIKRAQQGSMQGGHEFKTEIELLSRVHHKNLVGLVGFCFEQREQMLVYEFVPNGTLRDSLSGIYLQ